MYKLGLIGCGNISLVHAENIKNLGSLKAVCDIIPERTSVFTSIYQINAYGSMDEMLAKEEIDLVVICSPDRFHAEHVIKSLQAGSHVLCETPFCLTSVAAIQMIDTGFFFRKKLFTVNQCRFSEGEEILLQALKDENIGNINSFLINCSYAKPPVSTQKENEDPDCYMPEMDNGFYAFYYIIGLMNRILGEINSLNRVKNNCLEVKMNSGVAGRIEFMRENTDHSHIAFLLTGNERSVELKGFPVQTIKRFNFKDANKKVLFQNSSLSDNSFQTDISGNYSKVYNALKLSLSGGENYLDPSFELCTLCEMEKIYTAMNDE